MYPEDQNQKPKKKHPKSKNSLTSYARYSGLAFQMIAVMLGGVFLGIKLDEITTMKPLFTVIFSIAGFTFSIWFAIRDVLKK